MTHHIKGKCRKTDIYVFEIRSRVTDQDSTSNRTGNPHKRIIEEGTRNPALGALDKKTWMAHRPNVKLLPM